MLQAKNVSKTYNAGKNSATRFQYRGTYWFGLRTLGPNGALKTSFIRIINQITQADTVKFSLTEKNLILIILKTLVICPKKEVFIKI
jgi:ABC-2 type transport system ATP-binding protein